ncbi:MAG: LON peptidase substrate-binding domain-containing protein [Gammaproteobacteria bacterium]
MQKNPFTLPYDKLPVTLPVFPLEGTIVMPGTDLPLNIFESRYLHMVFDVLGIHRMLGMVQPIPASSAASAPSLAATGCAGRIKWFNETDDGRILIVLAGVCRFDVGEEIATTRPYRRVVADWRRFSTDYEETDADIPDRHHIMALLRTYSATLGLDIAWDELSKLSGTALINLLSTRLPLNPNDKQALIEAVRVVDRAQLLSALLEMYIAHPKQAPTTRH